MKAAIQTRAAAESRSLTFVRSIAVQVPGVTVLPGEKLMYGGALDSDCCWWRAYIPIEFEAPPERAREELLEFLSMVTPAHEESRLTDDSAGCVVEYDLVLQVEPEPGSSPLGSPRKSQPFLALLRSPSLKWIVGRGNQRHLDELAAEVETRVAKMRTDRSTCRAIRVYVRRQARNAYFDVAKERLKEVVFLQRILEFLGLFA